MKNFFDNTDKKKIELKSIIVPGIILFSILFYCMFGGMIKKTRMDATVEAYEVKIESYSHSGTRGKNKGYYAKHYYIVDGKTFEYTPIIKSSIPISKMKDPTIFYNTADPSDAIAEYETKLYFGDYFVLVFFMGIIVVISKRVTLV